MKQALTLLALALASFAPVVHAQSACPRIEGRAALRWEEKQVPDLTFCRALDASGNELFSLSLARDYPFKGSRNRRAESSTINGGNTQWYRAEIATRPDVEARETAIKLNDGRDAYFNVQAESSEQLQTAFDVISSLAF